MRSFHSHRDGLSRASSQSRNAAGIAAVLAASISTTVYSQDSFSLQGVLGSQALDSLSGSETLRVRSALLQDSLVQELVSNPGHTLKASGTVRAQDGLQTTKFKHFYKGVEVLGSGTMVHLTAGGSSLTLAASPFSLDTTPSLEEQDVVALATSFWVANLKLVAAPELKILANDDEASAELIYIVKMESELEAIGGADYWINAHTGNLIAEVPHHLEIAPIDVFDADSVPMSEINPFDGSPLVINLKSMRQVLDNSQVIATPGTSANLAFENSKRTLGYYSERFGRDSFDDQGSQLTSIVNAGRDWANAFWDRQNNIMAYGSGDGQRIDDLTKSVDVAGHEMSHGVISSTANLAYMGESGALNEALADYFGKMIEGKNDWVIGSSIFLDQKTPVEQRGIRNLANPSLIKTRFLASSGLMMSVPAPSNVKNQLRVSKGKACDQSNDRCYVHGNSTIISNLAYRIHKSIGQNRTEQMLYQTLTHRLTETSNFRSFKTATLAACKSLYTTFTCKKVSQAFTEAGL